MEKIETLTKVLQIRENEKNIAQLAHSHSVDTFEKVATKLYSLLRKKEDAEKSFRNVTKQKTSIETIRDQASYMDTLNKQIIELQSEVNKARHVMETKQGKLTDAHVEVKKFEKMIEFRREEQTKRLNKMESNSMDEISLQQYLAAIR